MGLSCNRATESNTRVSFSLEFNPLKMKKEGSKPSKIDILVCFCPYLDIKKTLTCCIKVVLSIWWRCGDSHSGPSTVPQRSLQFIKSLIFTAYQLLRTLHRYFVMFSSITTNIIMAYLLFMTSYLNVRRCTFKTRAS